MTIIINLITIPPSNYNLPLNFSILPLSPPQFSHPSTFTPFHLHIYETTIHLTTLLSLLPLSLSTLMGFPVGYTHLFLPKLLIHILTLLNLIRKLISFIFHLAGLENFLEPESSPDPTRPEPATHFHSISATLIRDLLPVVKFSDLVDPPESCAVCLHEFDASDEIRRLMNCSHVFHRCCLDRWMDHDQKTCPLCRKMFVPDDLKDLFNERLWAASGIVDYYGESLMVSGL